jgi:hypothetical protein
MAGDAGGETDKMAVLSISKEEICIYEQMCLNPDTKHLDVAHNQYRFSSTTTEKC